MADTLIRKVHHVAYRCKDAKQTVEWYGKYLGMGFILAIAEDAVPSTGEADPYMHVFLDAGSGRVERLAQHAQVADVIREQQHEARVEEPALRVAQAAVRVDQHLVEVVAGRVRAQRPAGQGLGRQHPLADGRAGLIS